VGSEEKEGRGGEGREKGEKRGKKEV